MSCLPPESISDIVSCLRDDKRSLQACSLAASIFLPFAREHLFSEIFLEVSSVGAFVQVLDGPWCTMSPALKRIIIGNRKHRHLLYEYIPQDRPRLLSRLQCVQSVRFQDVRLESVSPPLWGLLQNLQGVRELEIHKMVFEKPEHFFQYICSLPALEALSISKSYIGTSHSTDLAQFHPHTSFCIPLLDMDTLSPAVLDWFMRQNPFPAVHTLTFSLGNAVAASVLARGQYMQVLGPSVRNLQITVQSNPRITDLDLTLFTGLRSLYIAGGIQLGDAGTHFLEKLRIVFSQVKSSKFDEVSLRVALYACTEAVSFFGIPDGLLFQNVAWGELSQMLRDMSYRKLRLTIAGLMSYEWKQAETFLLNGPLENLDVCLEFVSMQ